MRSKVLYPPTLAADFYKISHVRQFPDKTEYVSSTWIPRESRIAGIEGVIAFGFQAFIKEFLIEDFNRNFFARDVDELCAEYERVITNTLGEAAADSSHWRALHALGHLPIEIRAVKEGTRVPLRVPMLTMENTNPKFFWLTNYLESVFSAEVWQTITSATIAREYRTVLDHWCEVTGGDPDFTPFQGHDFSFRGMVKRLGAAASGAGHLLSFHGTDTIPAVLFLEAYYNANIETELVGTSIPATEHTVMCSHGQAEYETIKYLITELYPNGPISIVCDTWDFFNVLTRVLPLLKDEIMAREGGPVVVRPDSGDPADIICGTHNWYGAHQDSDHESPESKGAIELLWDTFGGTVNEMGYKTLDPHVGLIYGDSITLDRCKDICKRLAAKRFVPRMVLGIGSFSYQYTTRDTFGFKLGATWVQIDGEGRNIFKDPATDPNHMKKSLTGHVVVQEAEEDGHLFVVDNLSEDEWRAIIEDGGDLMEIVFRDGELLRDETYADISARVLANA